MFRRRVLQWLSGSGQKGEAPGSPAVADLSRALVERWPKAGVAIEPDFVTALIDGVGVGLPTGRLRQLEACRPGRVVFEQAHLLAEVSRVLLRPTARVVAGRRWPVVVPQWRVERSDLGRLQTQRLVEGLDVAWGTCEERGAGQRVLVLDTVGMAPRSSGSGEVRTGEGSGFNPELCAPRYGLRRAGLDGVESRVWTLPDQEPGQEPLLAASRLLDPLGWGGGFGWSPGLVVAVPCSDRLWVAHRSDLEACVWVLERAWEDWLGRTHALIPRPLLRTTSGWVLWEGHA